jgi:hypothetical protein
MQAFLQFASDTPDNRSCAARIEYGSAPSPSVSDRTIYGFKVKEKEIFVGHVLNELEAMEVPKEIYERFPDITRDEWEATIRIATMILQAFSPYKQASE